MQYQIWSKMKEGCLLYMLILLQDKENLLFRQGLLAQILHSPPCQPVKKVVLESGFRSNAISQTG